MKNVKLLLKSTLVVSFFLLSIFQSSANPSIQVVPQSFPGKYKLSVNQLPFNVTNVFWILGDGHFRYGIFPIDHYLLDNTNNYVQAYLLEPYKLTPPTKLTCGSCTNVVAPQSVSNPTVALSSVEPIRVGSSWNPTRGGMHYSIISFENNGNANSGTISVDFQNNVNFIQIENMDNNSNWYTNLSVGVGNVLSFEYNNMAIGEQRHVLVKTYVDFMTIGTSISYDVVMDNGQDVIYNNTIHTNIRRFPHDPNLKEASVEMICPNDKNPTSIEYTITFQNIGEDYATTTEIIDNLPPELDLSTINFVGSSHPCSFMIDGSTLTVFFDNIQLPGTNQIYPHIPQPSETIGHVVFNIETHPCLEPGQILNEAEIQFDNLDVIITPMSVINVDPYEECLFLIDPCYNDDELESSPPWEEGFVAGPASLDVYPNPASDQCSIDVDLGINQKDFISLQIYDIRGVLIEDLTEHIYDIKGKQSVSLSMTNWAKGIYFVQLKSTNETNSWKFTKI